MKRLQAVLVALATGAAGYVFGSSRIPRVHAARDEAKALMQIDREFDAATAKDGIDGWVSFFADDGVMMPAGSDMIVGKAAIREYESKAFATPGLSLRWEPVDAGASGDVGYTYGLYKLTRDGPEGKPVSSYGKYVTIWRKQRDRAWKVAVDIGNSSPPPSKPAQ